MDTAIIPDILFSSILLFFIINGYRKGLINEIVRLTGLFISCFVAKRYHMELIPFIEEYFINEKLIQIIAFLIIFLITIIIIRILSSLIQKLFEIVYLGWINKLLGSLLGCIKGLIVISLIIFCMSILPEEIVGKIKKDSIIYDVGNNIKNNYLKLPNNLDFSTPKINFDQFEKINIPSLDSLINK